jgi:hypothetical protein
MTHELDEYQILLAHPTQATPCSFSSDSDSDSNQSIDKNYIAPTSSTPRQSRSKSKTPQTIREHKFQKLQHIQNYNPPAHEDREINYGNLPQIDIWVAKAQGLSQAQVERIAGFNKPQKEEGEGGEVNVLCDGGIGAYVQTTRDIEEVARVAGTLLPDE